MNYAITESPTGPDVVMRVYFDLRCPNESMKLDLYQLKNDIDEAELERYKPACPEVKGRLIPEFLSFLRSGWQSPGKIYQNPLVLEAYDGNRGGGGPDRPRPPLQIRHTSSAGAPSC